MLTAKISASASGDNQIVAGTPGRRIRVLGYVLSFSGTVNAKWKDAAGGNDSTGLLYGVANTLVSAPVCPPVVGSQLYWFQTAPGGDLTLNLSGAVAVGGHVVYDLSS